MFQSKQSSQFLCKINLYLNDSRAVPIPLFHTENNETGFYQTLIDGTKKSPRISKIDFSFSEDFTENRAGGYYSISCSFKSKNSNKERALNLEELKQVHYIGLVYKDGTEIIIGRNDRVQNAKPSISITANENFTEAKFSCNSLMPATTNYTVNSDYSFTYPFLYF